jgi:hypothetical protein
MPKIAIIWLLRKLLPVRDSNAAEEFESLNIRSPLVIPRELTSYDSAHKHLIRDLFEREQLLSKRP